MKKDKILETHKQLQKLYDVIYLIKDKEERAIISNLFQDLSDKLLDNQRGAGGPAGHKLASKKKMLTS